MKWYVHLARRPANAMCTKEACTLCNDALWPMHKKATSNSIKSRAIQYVHVREYSFKILGKKKKRKGTIFRASVSPQSLHLEVFAAKIKDSQDAWWASPDIYIYRVTSVRFRPTTWQYAEGHLHHLVKAEHLVIDMQYLWYFYTIPANALAFLSGASCRGRKGARRDGIRLFFLVIYAHNICLLR